MLVQPNTNRRDFRHIYVYKINLRQEYSCIKTAVMSHMVTRGGLLYSGYEILI